jgi:hypothetical protein
VHLYNNANATPRNHTPHSLTRCDRLYTAVGFVEESEFNNDKASVKYRVVTLLSAVRMLLRSMWCHHANSNSNNTTCQLHSIAAAAAAIIGDVSLTTTLLGL